MSHSLDILPPKKREEKIDHPVHENLLQPPFNALLVAPTACGKSSVVLNLLLNSNFYRNSFEKVYYFSPSVYIDKTLKAVAEDPDIIKIHEDDDLDRMDDFLKVIVADQKKLKDEDKDMPQVLVVVDDCLQYLKNTSYIGNLYTKSRHFNISCITTSQNYRSIPLKCRGNAQMILAFKLYSGTEVDKLEEEVGCSYPDWLKHYTEATRDRYSFLYMDGRNMKLFKCFTKLLWSKALDY